MNHDVFISYSSKEKSVADGVNVMEMIKIHFSKSEKII